LIENNDALVNLGGFNELNLIGGKVKILNNYNLISLTGLEGLTSIGDYLWISNNNSLSNLTGLVNLFFIEGFLAINDNITLTTLTGLDNIIFTSIEDLYIYNNYSLSTCEINSVCNYLLAPIGETDIHDNAIGCNSAEEVEEACDAVSVNELFFHEIIKIFPNPANQELNISVEGYIIQDVCVYNFTGQQIIVVSPVSNKVDISSLQPGMYIVEVTVENTRIRQKFLVQR